MYANDYERVGYFVKPRVYGEKDDVVTMISTIDAFGTVLVERADGERFPIHKYKLIPL